MVSQLFGTSQCPDFISILWIASRKSVDMFFGLKMEHGKVEIQTLHGFELDLIQSDEFYQANLDINNGAAVAQVEQVRT